MKKNFPILSYTRAQKYSKTSYDKEQDWYKTGIGHEQDCIRNVRGVEQDRNRTGTGTGTRTRTRTGTGTGTETGMVTRGGHHVTNLHQTLRKFKLKHKNEFPPNDFLISQTLS